MAFWNRSDTEKPEAAPAPAAKPAPAKVEVEPAAATAATGNGGEAAPFFRQSLSSDMSVTGKLSFAAPTRIDGKLKGEVRADDLLLIGAEGSVEGTVHAKALILEGSVRGDVLGTEWVQVQAGARLVGSVAAHRIEIAHGAKVQARMKIAPPKESKPERI